MPYIILDQEQRAELRALKARLGWNWNTFAQRFSFVDAYGRVVNYTIPQMLMVDKGKKPFPSWVIGYLTGVAEAMESVPVPTDDAPQSAELDQASEDVTAAPSRVAGALGGLRARIVTEPQQTTGDAFMHATVSVLADLFCEAEMGADPELVQDAYSKVAERLGIEAEVAAAIRQRAPLAGGRPETQAGVHVPHAPAPAPRRSLGAS